MPLPLYLAGQFLETEKTIDVINPYDDSHVESVSQADTSHIETAISEAEKSLDETRVLEPSERKNILDHITASLIERSDEFAETLTLENGKTIGESRGEVSRAISTFEYAAGEAWRVQGESYDAGITDAGKGRRILVRKFPIGVVSAISPFNFPLNLTAHKIAPAVATGCPIILKPASKTPLSCLKLAEIIAETTWPKGAFSCLPCNREAGQMLVEDERIKLLSFTGSPEVGWKMKRDAGKKKVVLELGGNAGLIIDKDIQNGVTLPVDRSSNEGGSSSKGGSDRRGWDWVIDRTSIGAFYQSGQSCISVQRIFCHEDIYDEFKKRLLEKASSLTIGNPMDESTGLGPIIDAKNADRIEQWISEAEKSGGTVLAGNERTGNSLNATIVESADKNTCLNKDEVFGPVVHIEPVASIEEAVEKVNDSVFGLQVGIFSDSFENIQYVFNNADVGGVVVNDIPSYRVDHMPYGGVKDSGLGREGIRYAMEDMLEPRVMVYFA